MNRQAEPLEHISGLQREVRLAPYTSLKVGGPADFFITARNPEQASRVLRWSIDRRLECRWIGGGSNLLVSDEGFEGLAARYLDDELHWPSDAEPLVVSGAGRSFLSLARQLARKGWGGQEWASTVPGTVGGAVVNNAGAFGSCVAEALSWADVVRPDGRRERLTLAELAYGYRASRLKLRQLGQLVVVQAAFRVHRDSPTAAEARFREFERYRTATQPRRLSAGSVFANPTGDFAGRLIQEAGLKGQRLGRAEISSQHANFIVNHGGASARDVYGLMRRAQDAVWSRFGCWLKPEIELLGRWSGTDQRALAGPVLEGAQA
jgi:UDP-N-acetylmuramate dehydrogenase